MKTSIARGLVLIGIAALSSLACGKPLNGTPSLQIPAERGEATEPALVLHLLNASRQRPSIDVEVFIDGKLAISDTVDSFSPADMPVVSIAPHKTHSLNPGPGRHVLRAISRKGEAVLEQEFEIHKRHWAVLGYEYSMSGEKGEKQFEFTIRSEPIMFE